MGTRLAKTRPGATADTTPGAAGGEPKPPAVHGPPVTPSTLRRTTLRSLLFGTTCGIAATLLYGWAGDPILGAFSGGVAVALVAALTTVPPTLAELAAERRPASKWGAALGCGALATVSAVLAVVQVKYMSMVLDAGYAEAAGRVVRFAQSGRYLTPELAWLFWPFAILAAGRLHGWRVGVQVPTVFLGASLLSFASVCFASGRLLSPFWYLLWRVLCGAPPLLLLPLCAWGADRLEQRWFSVHAEEPTDWRGRLDGAAEPSSTVSTGARARPEGSPKGGRQRRSGLRRAVARGGLPARPFP